MPSRRDAVRLLRLRRAFQRGHSCPAIFRGQGKLGAEQTLDRSCCQSDRKHRPAGMACIIRPRAATSASASGKLKTPARVAATYSPTL